MQSKRVIDMTEGPIMRKVALFALPICIGNVLQQLYNTVDTMVVGNYCGHVALAAVSTSAQPVELLLCIFLGIGTGVSILVAQSVGRGDMEYVKKSAATATSFLFLCSLPLTAAGMFIGPALLKLMRCPDDAWRDAVVYVRIVFLGTLGNMGYNMNAGILRGLGDSKASLIFLFISCVANVGLDLFFVAVVHMDAAGVALSTTVAMFISWFFSVWYIRKKYPDLGFTILPSSLDKGILRRVIAVGLPLGLNNSIYSVGHILLQSLINAQGDVFMAGCSVASKLTGITNVAINSFSSAATTFSGQNLGAKNYSRIRRGARVIPISSGLITGAAGILMFFFCPYILRLFNREPEVLEVAIRYTRIVIPFTWPFAIFNAMIAFVNGIGEVRFPTVINILMLWVVRIPSAYLIARYIDGAYLMAAFPISFTFGMCAMSTFFLTRKWRRIRELERGEEHV